MWKKIKDWCVEHWEKIEDWRIEHDEVVATFLASTVVLLVIFFIYQVFYVPFTKPVTPTSQEQAETTEGVKKAADNAHIKLDYGQQKQISETIREIRVTEKEPVYIIQTTGDKAQEVSEKASKQEKADFSIVTDKDHPGEAVELDKLDKNTTVNLNQYNVQAYKKHINTIEYYPQEKTIGYTHQWKISKSGKYMGVGIDYDTDDGRIMAKVTYSW